MWRVALVDDARCLLHQANYAHVECPQRVLRTRQLLNDRALLSRDTIDVIAAREATTDELLLTHAREHIDLIDSHARLDYKPDEPDSEDEDDPHTTYPDCKYLDGDTYVGRNSPCAARVAVGGLIELGVRILDREPSSNSNSKSNSNPRVSRGFALIRPPGHHAEHSCAQGFCLYNNVACAVNVWRQRGLLRRCVIVDWDVHHGNGTQRCFYADRDVLYVSIHRHENGHFYPHTGAADECGEHDGLGYTVNIPLNSTGLGDREYLMAWQHVVLPICRQFAPDVIVVSAGFDCAQGDPLGGMHVTPACFAQLTHQLATIPARAAAEESSASASSTSTPAYIPIVLALEGGYNLDSVAQSVCSCMEALLGHVLPDVSTVLRQREFVSDREQRVYEEKHARFVDDLARTMDVLRAHWTLGPAPRVDEAEDQRSVENGEDSAAAAAAPSKPASSMSLAESFALARERRKQQQQQQQQARKTDDAQANPDWLS